MRRQAEEYHPDLGAAMELLISAGGKRIRPALTILTGKMLGGQEECLITLATAIELLHTATLVHDDLIDGALLRRGMPTLNSKWSPATTVLTGDFIFARAAKLAAETENLRVMKLFSHTLTIIVEGEIVQLLNSRCAADRENYMKRIYAKTASLFETSALAASYIGQADENTSEHLRRFGQEIGTAFQIVDDILDFTGDQATVGKPVGSDLRQGIVTLPVILFTEMNPNDPHARMLREGNCLNDEQVDSIIATIRKSGAIRAAHQEAVACVERGLTELRTMPSSEERFALEDLANYIIERKF